jgi:hypothetical protein
MNFLKKLLGRSSKGQLKEITQSVCPNYWGDQEYENVIREKYKDPQIDVNNHEANYAFVQDFIVTHLNGIKLKSTATGGQCPRCKTVYKE